MTAINRIAPPAMIVFTPLRQKPLHRASPSVFVDGALGGHDRRQRPEVCPGDLLLLQVQLLVDVLQADGELLEALVVDLVEVDAAVAASDAAVET